MKWNDDWRTELEQTDPPCFYALCECRNSRKDIVKMARLMYKYNADRTKEECFDRMLEWVGVWNDQWETTDLTPYQYEFMLDMI